MSRAALLACFFVAGSAHAVDAVDVKVAKRPADIAGCVVVGAFSSTAKMLGSARDLKSQAATAGADTIIISQSNPFAFFTLNATGYKCQR